MGHTDVVGVERDKWTVDPFEGVIKDGFLYGRGASDDKCMTTVCLEVMLLLKRLNVPLDRDVIFVAEADEESTSRGIIELVEKHWDKIDCEFALNEGGGIVEENGKVQVCRRGHLREGPAFALPRVKGHQRPRLAPAARQRPRATSPPRSRRSAAPGSPRCGSTTRPAPILNASPRSARRKRRGCTRTSTTRSSARRCRRFSG